jgi:murein DD-endopeptidase MepM/ murein hydrolase activator NlpD
MNYLNPVNKGKITQHYGENPELYQERFGIKYHNGVDIVSFHGDKLYAPEDGYIYKYYDLSHGSVSKGFGVCILGNPDENGFCNEWVLWHTMSNVQIPKDGKVKQGDIVAYEGDSGAVFQNGVEVPDSQKGVKPFPGTHLHLGLRKVHQMKSPIHPLKNIHGDYYKDIDGFYYNISNINNQVEGFVDPLKEELEEYIDFIPEKVLETTTEAIKLIPQLPQEQQKTWYEAFKEILTEILNYWKGRFKK